MLTDQIFIPGVLAYNFNPSRQTIIKAITNNSYKVVNFLLNNISKKITMNALNDQLSWEQFQIQSSKVKTNKKNI